MRPSRSLALVAAGVAAAAGLVLPSPAMATVPSCMVNGAPGTVVAVTGSDRAVYYRCQDNPSANFSPLGGFSTSAPSVLTTASNVYFLVSGQDHSLYIRTLDLPWTKAVASAYCIQPAMALKSSTEIVVACKGGNGQLYTSTTTFTDGQLPRWTTFTSLGGALAGGPALAVVGTVGGTTVQYYVVGTNHLPYENNGGVPGRFSSIGTYGCSDTLAVTSAGTSVYVGCVGQLSGAALYASNASNGDPSGWSVFQSLGGVLQRVPALVATRDATGALAALTFFGMGSNDRLYQRQISPTASAWTLVGGLLRRGVGAAQLQP